MFKPTHGPINPTVIWGTAGLLIAIILATTTSLWLALEVRREQQTMTELIHQEPQNAIEHLQAWQSRRNWELLSIAIDVLVLLATAGALLLLARGYFGSQRSLQEVQTLAWHILASVDQAVLTVDHAGRITSVNSCGQKLLNMKESSLGQPLSDVCGDYLPLAEVAREVVKSGVPVYDFDITLHKQGFSTQLRADAHLLRDAGDQEIGVVIYVRDVTERILIEERMRRMERFMGLGTLAAGLHHEIKNPLSALSLHVQLLEERLEDNTDDEVRENLGVLKTEVTRINGVLESFRDFASVETLNRANMDVSQLLTQTANLIRPKAEEQNVELSLDLPHDCLPPVLADAARLEQVLLNLVINSLEAMPGGGRLGVGVHQEDGYARIDIADTGPGIPENVRGRIFDPYFTTKSEGSGMGLAVCDKVVQQHGGEIGFDTGPAGTVFHVLIPLDASAWKTHPSRS